MKKSSKLLALATVLALAMTGCFRKASDPINNDSASEVAIVKDTSAIDWTTVATAADAAKAAGLGTFGVPRKITVGDLIYKNPTFAATEGVAQATYETPASMLYIRKGAAGHTVPLTDRSKAQFAATWTEHLEDVDVTMYGESNGAATVLTFAIGTDEYGVTIQGLGGDELSMNEDQVAAIVKDLKEANATGTDDEASQQSGNQQDGNPLSQSDVESIVENSGLGTIESMQQVQGSDGIWYWEVVVTDGDGNTREIMIDPDGNWKEATATTSDSGVQENQLSTQDVAAIIDNNNLGQLEDMQMTQGSDGIWYWEVTTSGDDGSYHTILIDPHGNYREE